MKIKSTSKLTIGLYVLLALLVVLLFLPIKVPYSIQVTGKMYPIKEWVISKGTDGLLSTLVDNSSGLTQDYHITQFINGDAARFSLLQNITSDLQVSINDTIAIIYSNEVERQLVEMQGLLENAKASLAMYSTDEKDPVIEEERERLTFMKKQAQEQWRVHERQKALFEKNLISAAEYEITKGTAELYDINIGIAEAHLKTVTTGSKTEEVEYYSSLVKSYQNQIEVLQKRTSGNFLISQINGYAKRITTGDTLLIVSDRSEYVCVMPVKWELKKFVNPGQKVRINARSVDETPVAEVLRIDPTVHTLMGDGQVSLVSAVADDGIENLAPGLMVKCYIECKPVTPLEYVKRIFL